MLRRRMQRTTVAACALALVAAACSSGGGDETSGAAADGDDGATDAGASSPATFEETAEGILTDERLAEYLDEADLVPLAESDAAAPARLPEQPGGASGYSRYVFREYEGQVLTSLVEGPLGEQVRCQDVELPCSFSDLRELHESGDEVPEELGLTRDELGDLVSELEATNEAVRYYADPDTACAEGFRSDRTQTPNMGTHFFNAARLTDGEFDPAEPEIIMYARADGEAPEGQLGRCEGGEWQGDELEAVAAAFILFTGATDDAHPEGYTGEFDNWHVHYNLCRAPGVDSIAPQDVCEEAGGTFYPTLGWMMHAWAEPEFDNQLGVFSMWNPTLWPRSDPEEIHERWVARPDDLPEGGAYLPIENFEFGTVEVEAGKPLVIGNSDSVPHTVTDSGSDTPGDEFDSGVFAPGESYELTFDEPGSYPFFCALHPDMRGTIVVE